ARRSDRDDHASRDSRWRDLHAPQLAVVWRDQGCPGVWWQLRDAAFDRARSRKREMTAPGTAGGSKRGMATAIAAACAWLILIGVVLARKQVAGWCSARFESRRSAGFEMKLTDSLPFEDSAARELPKAV